jgi:hypothetical protein
MKTHGAFLTSALDKVVSLKLMWPYPQYPLDRKLGGPQHQSEYGGKETKSQPPGHLGYSLVTVLTEQLWLQSACTINVHIDVPETLMLKKCCILFEDLLWHYSTHSSGVHIAALLVLFTVGN